MLLFSLVKAQTSQEEFGTNRVQYKDFLWSYYSSERFSVYFNLGGQELGKYVMMDANAQIEDIENSLEYRLQEPVDIMVYNNLGDLKQSNIGRNTEFQNTGGVTKIIGNKIFIYFNGSHQDLRAQLREGIATLCIQNMMYGGSIQEVLQNAVLLNLPNWYSLGLSAYIGESWNADIDAELRDPIMSMKYKNINKLGSVDAIMAGHSFWHYIALTYGKSTIPNILYLTRINHNLESGFSYVIGKPMSLVLNDWFNFYFNYYSNNMKNNFLDAKENQLPIRTRKNKTYTHFAINTTANLAAYVVDDIGLYKVRIYDIENKKSKKVFRGGYRDISMPVDISQPMLAWDPTGKTLAIIYEHRAKTYLLTYNTEEKKKEKKLIANFQKIVSFSYGENPNQLVLSAINRGQSDIYTYNIASSKVNQITNDFWDDLNPYFVKLYNRQGILFSSNRPDDTIRFIKQIDSLLPVKPLDLFFYNTKTNSKALVQITQTPAFNESSPIAFNNKYFAYLSERNKVSNRNIAYIDSVFHHNDYYYYFPDSTVLNPKYNIDSLKLLGEWKPDSLNTIPVFKDVSHSFAQSSNSVGMTNQYIALKKNQIIEQYSRKGKPIFSITKVNENDINTTEISYYVADTSKKSILKDSINKIIPVIKDTVVPKLDTVLFQSEFYNSSTIEQYVGGKNPDIVNNQSITIKQTDDSNKNFKTGKYRFGKILPYSVKFTNEYVVSQLDNSLVINRYQSYTNTGGQFQNPNLSALIKLGITDLFEDYKIIGGFRLPTNISGTEYFITFEDYKKRLDKKYTYYRRVSSASYDFTSAGAFRPVSAKLKTNYAEANLRYPLDFNRSIRTIISLRQEKVLYQASDTFSLSLNPYNQNWASVRAEYVFDNTYKVQLNILNGTRYKFYTDAQRLLNSKQITNSDNVFLFVVGADYRKYVRIHRQIVWASRINFATSFGDAKVAYLLGGTENWILPKQVQADPNSTDQSVYAFQSLSTNLRGFEQSSRKGNSTALINTEIRFPIFSYLSKAPINSEFTKNFQLVAFYDVGTSWQGFSPYSEDNPFNTKIIVRPPVTVKVNYYREPIIMGFGLGARTTLFGYFIRVDYAKGFDSGELRKAIWHFSLGTDF